MKGASENFIFPDYKLEWFRTELTHGLGVRIVMPRDVCERFDGLPDQDWVDIVKPWSGYKNFPSSRDLFREKIFDHEYL